MDMYFEDQKSKILKYIDDRGEELARLLYKFKEEFDEDRALRLDREAVIVKQLTDHEQEVNERFENQIVSLFTPVVHLFNRRDSHNYFSRACLSFSFFFVF